MKGMRRWVLALVVALPVVVVPAGAVSARPACNPIYVEAYDVEVVSDRLSYRIGQTAKLFAEVTRKQTGEPEADVTVGVMIRRGEHAYDIARTRGDGSAVLKIKLRRGSIKPGPVALKAFAWKRQVDAVCAWVEEFGKYQTRRAFRVRP